MIVTCQNCDTSFQLDDARVPPQGIRVRCSRCKQAFFLAHPSASPDEAIHAVAASAGVAALWLSTYFVYMVREQQIEQMIDIESQRYDQRYVRRLRQNPGGA